MTDTDVIELDLPRDDLIRLAEPLELRAEDGGDGRTMVGYPVVFNTPTEINSWEGNFIETIAPGALRKTLRENGDSVKVLFNHGMDPQIGDKPLGVPRVMREDKNGLYTEVPLANTSYNEDLAELMRTGAIDGMSFRFRVTKEKMNKNPKASVYNPRALPERTITELRLMEFGPVTFPAYQATTVGVRSREHFAAWRATDESKRARIAEILGLDTHDAEAGGEAPTSDAGAVDIETVEPARTTPRLTALQRRLRVADLRRISLESH